MNNCPRCNCLLKIGSKEEHLYLFLCGTYVDGDKVYQSAKCEADTTEYRRKLLEAACKQMDGKMRDL